MAIKSVLCHVSQSHVRVVADLEGSITRLICSEYEEATGLCRLRKTALSGGPLSNLLERLDEGTLDRPATRCELMHSLAASDS
jgi:hypothetical protein